MLSTHAELLSLASVLGESVLQPQHLSNLKMFALKFTGVMKFQVFVGFAVALCILDLAWTYPYGAPDQSCSDMMPMHYVNKSRTNPLHAPQKTEPYFTIRVDATWNYVAGDTVEGELLVLAQNVYLFELRR